MSIVTYPPSDARRTFALIPAPDRMIALHLNDCGQPCVMSRARVSSLVTACPLGCAGGTRSILVRDAVPVGVSDVMDAVDNLLSDRTHLVSQLMGGHEVKVFGHATRADVLTLSVDGGAKEFELIIREVR